MNALGHQDIPMFIGVKNVDVKFSRMKPQTHEKIPLYKLTKGFSVM